MLLYGKVILSLSVSLIISGGLDYMFFLGIYMGNWIFGKFGKCFLYIYGDLVKAGFCIIIIDAVYLY